MDTTKYRNLFEYVKNHKYPPGFSKQDKLILRRGARNFELEHKIAVAILFGQAKGWNNPQATCHQRMTRKRGCLRNATRQISLARDRQGQHHKKNKQRVYWPDYYKDTVEMV